MIVFLLLFIGLPIAMTLVFGDKDRTIAYWMPMSLVIIFVLWTVISLPCALTQTKFHVPLYIFIVVMILLVGFLVFMLIKRRKEVIKKIKCFFYSDAKKYFTNVFFIIMLVLVLYQAGRVTIFEPSEHRDSKSYTSVANDIIENDSFNDVAELTGAEITDVSKVTTKLRLSTWYSFESALAVLTNKKPLTLNNTILPGFLIIVTYLIWWGLCSKFFKNDVSKMSLFMIVLIVLYEVVSDDITAIFLMWPTWGKNITAMIVVPFIIYEWILLVDNDKNNLGNIGELLMLSFAGCAASNMGFMIIPIELSFLLIVSSVFARKLDIKLICKYIISVLPPLIYVGLYFVFK